MDCILILSLSLLGFVYGYIAGKYSRRATENRGEVLIRQSLAKYCENKDAHVLNNVTLRLEDGSTTQIDHILIATNGVFIIETKHYKGWIFANAKSKFWTQTIYSEKYKFQNPIFQNYKHVKALQNLFDFLEPQLIHNIVVFSGKSVFKTPKPVNVCYREELIPTIEQNSDRVLSLNRIQFCVGRLEYMRLELTRKTDIEHQAYLTQRFGRQL
ncbi:MAG: nuclease-related domain-containing protein [Legionellaceae bacterium]|nr:nuclease-related domain-containing protein [Legionellaceae bacterium]